MSEKIPVLAAFALAVLLASGASATSTRPVDAAAKSGALPALPADHTFVPSGKGLPMMKPGGAAAENAATKARARKSPGITYHGGPVMLGTVNAYYVWYGDWTGSAAPGILTDFISHLGGSRYERINTTYFDRSRQHVSGQVQFAGATSVPAYLGSSLGDEDVRQVVADAIGSGALPRDANGVYFVLGAAGVGETSGFCTQYCGWHTSDTIAGTDIKYAFIGNPARCPDACEGQRSGPNGDAAADGMASIIAHEGEEAISDPDLDAWYDGRGMENADKCAWTYGATTKAANGARYNVTLGTRHYLVQQNWLNVGAGSCASSY